MSAAASPLTAKLPTPQGCFVGRQAILDRRGKVMGYELLDRHAQGNTAPGEDGEAATARVLHHAMHVLHPRKLLEKRQAFVNFTRAGLIDGLYSVAPPRLLVVELLEDIQADREVVAAARQVRKLGYTLALDDFADHPQYEALTSLADVIKIDWLLTTPAQRQRMIQQLARPGLRFLAEKVETPQEHSEAMRLGCQMFQGYYYQKPELISGRSLPTTVISLTRFLGSVNQPEVDFNELERVVRQDGNLAAQLLKRINLMEDRCTQHVASIRQALVLLGENPLRRWAAVSVMATLAQDKPSVLMVNAVARAQFCETIGPQIGIDRAFDCFMVGLISLLDAATDQTMSDILSTLELPDAMQQGLLNGTGDLGRVLHLARACERYDLAQVAHAVEGYNLEPTDIIAAYSTASMQAEKAIL